MKRSYKSPKLFSIAIMLLFLNFNCSVFGQALNLYTVTVNYYFENTTVMIAEPYAAQIPGGMNYSVISPAIDKFVLKDHLQNTISGTADGNKTVNVFYKYAADVVNYYVEYYQRNPVSDTFDRVERSTHQGKIGTVVTVDNKYYDDYYIITNDLTLEVTGDSPTKKLYYELKDKQFVVFKTGGSYVEPITARATSDISSERVERLSIIPSKAGYIFNGWDKAIPSAMPEETLLVNALWIPGTSQYHVIHWQQNLTRDGYVIVESDLKSGTTEGTATFTAKTYTGFDYARADQNVTITADNQAVLNVYYDRQLWTYYFYVETYLFKTIKGYYGTPCINWPTEAETIAESKRRTGATGDFFVTGYYDINSIYWLYGDEDLRTFDMADQKKFYAKTGSGIYPSTTKRYTHTITKFYETFINNQYESVSPRVYSYIRAEPALNIQDPIGFTVYQHNEQLLYPEVYGGTYGQWAGWESVDRYSSAEGVTLSRMIMRGITYIRHKRNSYTVKYVSNGVNFKTTTYKYQQPIDLTVIPDVIPSDYEFLGWYESSDDFKLREALTAKTTPASNISLYAKLQRKKVTLTFNSQGGTPVPSQELIGGTSAAEPADPTRTGSHFRGWYLEDGTRWVFDRTVESNTTLYAHWDEEIATKYTIRHIRVETGETLKTTDFTGFAGATVTGRAMESLDAGYPENIYLVPDYTTKSLMVNADETQNVITFYYRDFSIRQYTVKYLFRGDNSEIANTEIQQTSNTVVTELAKDIGGYLPESTYQVATLGHDSEENVIIFYYNRSASGVISVVGTVFPFVYNEGYPEFDEQFPITASLYPEGTSLEDIVYGNVAPSYTALSVLYQKEPCIPEAPLKPGDMGWSNNAGLAVDWSSLNRVSPKEPDNTPVGCSALPEKPIGVFTFTGVVPGTYLMLLERPGFLLRLARISADADDKYIGHRELLAGDFNRDLVTEYSDLSLFNQKMGLNWGEEGYDPKYDINGDSAIDESDLSLLNYYMGASIEMYVETMTLLGE